MDIEIGHLKVIKRDNPGDTSGCCKDLWKKWLEVDADATWEKLFIAIDSTILSSTGKDRFCRLSLWFLNCVIKV